MKLLVTRPQHDVTTRYLSSWAVEVINFAKMRGVEVCDLVKEKANKVEFEGRIRKIKPEIVFLNGHGSDDCVTGHDNNSLVDTRENYDILDDKITYALSCNSGKNLGVKVVENGIATYIGYSDEFIFVADNNYISKPADDPKALPFMEASNQVMISLLKGHSAQDASERSRNKFKDNYSKLLSSNANPDTLQAAQCLWWNMRNQVCLGDGNAKL